MRRRKADQEGRHQKRAAIHDAYRVAKQQRTAARRALEWIGMLKAQLVLDMKYQTCYTDNLINSTGIWKIKSKCSIGL